MGRHGSVRHQRSFYRCGWSCADVGLASFRDWCFTGDRVDRPRCALRFRKRVEHGERAQLDANASRGRRGEQPHTSQRQCLLDRERIGLASVFHVKPTHSRPSHRRTRSRCDLARRPAFRPRGCGRRARRDLGRWYGHNGAGRPVRRVGRRIPHVSRETSSTIRVLCLDGCRSSSWERGRSRGCGRRRVWEYACAVGHIDESCKPAPGDATADALRAESTLGWGSSAPRPCPHATSLRQRTGVSRETPANHRTERAAGVYETSSCTRRTVAVNDPRASASRLDRRNRRLGAGPERLRQRRPARSAHALWGHLLLRGAALAAVSPVR